MHAERRRSGARTVAVVPSACQKRLHGGPVAAALDQQEIVVLRRERQEAEAVHVAPPSAIATPQSARPCATAAATALCERGWLP